MAAPNAAPESSVAMSGLMATKCLRESCRRDTQVQTGRQLLLKANEPDFLLATYK